MKKDEQYNAVLPFVCARGVNAMANRGNDVLYMNEDLV
jgi:hypothetical protein